MTQSLPTSLAPICFISYSWDSDAHKAWVLTLATDLRESGVDARLDRWELRLGMDLPNYMEQRIRESDFVLLVCTPEFAERADSGRGGVGYEKGIITGEIYHGEEPTKFIPAIRSGQPKQSLPSYLKNKLYVDFREDSRYEDAKQEILRHVFQLPESPMPPIGKPSVVKQIPGGQRADGELLFFEILLDYAQRNYSTLDINPGHIKEIAEGAKRLGYNTIHELDMSIRPVRHIARDVKCPKCQRYSCDQIAIALALANPDYLRMLGPHQTFHTEWLRENRPNLRKDKRGWL